MIQNYDGFQILKPEIFNDTEVIAGITYANKVIFPPLGFSITNGEIYSDEVTNNHREFLSNILNIDPYKMKYQKQVHGSRVRIIDFMSTIEESDGMITNLNGLILNAAIADCAAVLIYDPENKAVAAIHSGWRSSYENISQVGIDSMKENYNSKPENLLAYVSPCASVNNYDVGEDFYDFFDSKYLKIYNGKLYFDNKLRIHDSLINAGLIYKNIEISDVCTIANSDYHSFRRDKNDSGRMSAFIGIK